MSRRRLLRGAVVTVGGLAGAAMVGCSSAPKAAAPAGEAPKAAGTAAPAGRTYPKGALVPINKNPIKPGGTFTEAVTNVAPEFDSHTALTSMQWRTSGDLAILPDTWDGALVANIVESWETPDPTTVILKLRDKLPLHDIGPWAGKNFEAEDLAFNINRIAGNTAKAENLPKEIFQRASTMAGLVSAEATDKTHVKIKLDSPRGQWLAGFTDHRNFMMPKGVVEVGFKDASKLAGTGAFSVTSIDNSKEVYTRFDKWWGGKPNFDKYVRVALPDRAAQVAAFVSKQTQHFLTPTQQEAETIRKSRPDALYYETPGYLLNNIRPNHKLEFFKDFRVRKAISLSLNYQEMAEGAYGKSATLLGAMGTAYQEAWQADKVSSLAGINPSTKEKDIAEAVKLMTASGHEGGKGIEYEILVSFGSVPYRENSLRMQAQLLKIFPQLKIKVQPSPDAASFSKRQSGKDFQAIAYTIGPGSAMSTEVFTHFHTKGARNYQSSFDNKENDALIEKAVAALKLEERKQLLDTWQQKYWEEWMPIWFLQTPPVATFVAENVVGYQDAVGPWCEWYEYYLGGKMGFSA